MEKKLSTVTTEEALYNFINELGEINEGDLHIIETTDQYPCEDERSFRVYHKNGYCFDVKKEVESEDEDKVEYYYGFYAEWEGFDKIDAEKALELLMNHKSE